MRLLTKIGSLGAAAALAVAVAGCGNDSDDPEVRLTSSADALSQEPYKIEMTMGDMMNAQGSVDPDAGRTEMTMTMDAGLMSMQMRIITTPTDVWMDLGELGAMFDVDAPWMHVDLSRVPGGVMGVEPGGDPTNTVDFLRTAGEVEEDEDGTLHGVFDFTDAAPAMFDEAMLEGLGEDATKIAFTAELDDQDRLTRLVITLPETDAPADFGSVEIRYYDYGTPVEINEPPADQVSPMPAELYAMFGQM